MRRWVLHALAVLGIVALFYWGAMSLTQRADTRMRRAADCSAAASAVAASIPSATPGAVSADFWNPGSGTLAVVQVTSAQKPPRSFDVTVRWNPSTRSSVAQLVVPSAHPK